MPQLANLVLKDGAATPVNHTYAPRDITNGIATLEESNGVPIANNRIAVALTRTPQGRHKATLKGTFPVVQTQTINGVDSPVIVRSAYFDLTFSFSDTSTEQERKDVIALLASALKSDATVSYDMIAKLQAVY